MEYREVKYEIEYWNSKETSDRLYDNSHYHILLPQLDTLEYALSEYTKLIKKYECVVLKIVEKRIHLEYHKV